MATLEAGHVHAALILLDVDLTLGTSLAALTGLISPLLELSFTRLEERETVRQRQRGKGESSPGYRRSKGCGFLCS
jgi:hypothetical protein